MEKVDLEVEEEPEEEFAEEEDEDQADQYPGLATHPGPASCLRSSDGCRQSADGRWTVVSGARVVNGAEKKNHLIEAAPFGRLDQMLRTTV